MLKKIKTIWANRKLIIEGFKNYMFRHPEIEREAFNRLSICSNCELVDQEGDKCLMPGTAPCCGACGCKLALKVRSLASECAHPDGPRWTAKMTQEEQDAYYKEIKYNPDQD